MGNEMLGNHALVGFPLGIVRKERLFRPSTSVFSSFRRPYTEIGKHFQTTLFRPPCQPYPGTLFGQSRG
jgi:hypothetical protein